MELEVAIAGGGVSVAGHAKRAQQAPGNTDRMVQYVLKPLSATSRPME